MAVCRYHPSWPDTTCLIRSMWDCEMFGSENLLSVFHRDLISKCLHMQYTPTIGVLADI